MAWARVAVVDENYLPQAQVTVEAMDLDALAHGPLTTAVTDNGGMVLFLSLPDNKRYVFKPRTTRAAGSYGATTQYGKLNTQILAHSAMQCVDAYVEPSGQWSTDATIQAAFTRLGALTGRFTVFIQNGTYTENLTISSNTATFEVRGCGSVIANWPLAYPFAPSPGPVGAIIDGGNGVTLTLSGNKEVVLVGLELKNNSASATIAPSNAAVDVLLDNCYVHNDGAGSVIISASGPQQLRIRECIVVGAVGVDAINCPAATTLAIVERCSIQGRVISVGAQMQVRDTAINATNTTGVIYPGVSFGKVTRCTVTQAGTGDGVVLSNRGSVQFFWFIDHNDIEGVGTGNAINVGNNNVCQLTGNGLNSWSVGIKISATSAKATLRGNTYQSVTTFVSTSQPFLIGARAYANTAQSIPNGSLTKMQLDTVSFDPNGNFDKTTNYRYTCPASGYYQVNAQVEYDAGAAAGLFRTIQLFVNGVQRSVGEAQPGHTTYQGLVATDLLQLNAGDYVEVFVYQDSGAAAPLLLIAGAANYMSIYLVQQ